VPERGVGRLVSIDVLRGAVMVLMAIDHVRVFSGVPAGGPTPGVFFTRWITHFCAPAFVFLAGTSAFLYGRRHDDLPRFLLTRGLWLVFLEFTVLRFAWTFNLDVLHAMAGVIWVLGISMILLAGLVRLPVAAVGTFGVLLVALHNVTDFVPGFAAAARASSLSWLWSILYVAFWTGPFRLGSSGPEIIVLYSVIPWVGVMAAGYAFGTVVTAAPERRRRACLALGLGATVLFVLLRAFVRYGDPSPWPPMPEAGRPAMPLLLSFLDTTKYPASLDFLLMTLGPAIAVLPFLETARGAVARALAVFGRVPFFFYVLHLFLIHALALGVSVLLHGSVSPWLFRNHPMAAGRPPAGYAWSLPVLYATWAVAVAILYAACRWYADLKARRTDAWLKYL
jgi:uncharacterized membrane protein